MDRTRHEWQPENGQRRQNRQRTRWRDEIGSFVGITWNRQAADSDVCIGWERSLFCSGLIKTDDDHHYYDDYDDGCSFFMEYTH